MSTLNLYANSLRHLRPIQLSSRLHMLTRRKLLYRSEGYRANRYAASEDAPFRRLRISAPGHRPETRHDFTRNRFTFLNHTCALSEPLDWFPTDATQLWKYNLHYFDYTVDLAWRYLVKHEEVAFQLFKRLADSWMAACPLATPLAWDPYPISLRTSNWLKAYTWFGPEIDRDLPFAARLRQSIWTQLRFLEDNLEYHLLGNHLIENGRALLLGGLFFQDKDGERWYRKGRQILADELQEQFLADGGHYERSPMYHQIMLHLYTDIIDALAQQGHAIPIELEQRTEDMHRWLQNMLHPDGEIALFNDAAFGIAGPAVAQVGPDALPDGFQALPESGYFVFRDNQMGNALLFDCGPLGPDHQPGHGHCDALSFELSVGGTRFIVDSGVSNYYGDENRRHYYRSTRAHNTIVVDEMEQSEIWGRFRVARRAYPGDVCYQAEKAGLAYAIGSHDGYQRLPGNPRHRRWVGWVDRRFWLICDHISGAGDHRLANLLHFHPDVALQEQGESHDSGRALLASRNGISLKICTWGAQHTRQIRGQAEPLQGWYAPEFGLNQANSVWSLEYTGPLSHWMGYVLWPGPDSFEVALEHADRHSCCVRISAEAATYMITCTYAEMKLEKL